MFTKPSARYTQASLVKRMKELNWPTSTYASNIKTITDRGYVEIKSSKKQMLHI
jgi:DNA topoisomerase IA